MPLPNAQAVAFAANPKPRNQTGYQPGRKDVKLGFRKRGRYGNESALQSRGVTGRATVPVSGCLVLVSGGGLRAWLSFG